MDSVVPMVDPKQLDTVKAIVKGLADEGFRISDDWQQNMAMVKPDPHRTSKLKLGEKSVPGISFVIDRLTEVTTEAMLELTAEGVTPNSLLTLTSWCGDFIHETKSTKVADFINGAGQKPYRGIVRKARAVLATLRGEP